MILLLHLYVFKVLKDHSRIEETDLCKIHAGLLTFDSLVYMFASDTCKNCSNKARSQTEIWMAHNTKHSALQGSTMQVS